MALAKVSKSRKSEIKAKTENEEPKKKSSQNESKWANNKRERNRKGDIVLKRGENGESNWAKY